MTLHAAFYFVDIILLRKNNAKYLEVSEIIYIFA